MKINTCRMQLKTIDVIVQIKSWECILFSVWMVQIRPTIFNFLYLFFFLKSFPSLRKQLTVLCVYYILFSSVITEGNAIVQPCREIVGGWVFLHY